MQFLTRINKISDRAELVGLSIWRLCEFAGVEYSTVARWRAGQSSPTLRKFSEFCEKLEAELVKREEQHRADLDAARQADTEPAE